MNQNQKRIYTTMVIFFTFLFAFVLVRSAWITEDAYITLRTVDNFINGYGLTWNVSERVQAFTHPMWMFLLSGLYFFTHESFYTTIFLSIFVSLTAFILVAAAIRRNRFGGYIGLSILLFSKSFIDYSTSGLENPLTHLLLASFFLTLLKVDEKPNNLRVFHLALFAGLGTFNRIDTFLYFIPALGYILWLRHDWKAVRNVALGLLPFVLWEIFSILYYGFPFPNTAYAKLNNGIPQLELLKQGYFYFINSIHWDPITLFSIGFSLILVTLNGSTKERMIALGIFLYLFYILWIGGDYMSGRFFSAALISATILISRKLAHIQFPESVMLFTFIIILGFISPTPTLTSIDDESFNTGRVDVNNISDERSFYYQPSNLLYDQLNLIQPYHDWVYKGLEMKRGSKKVFELFNVGYTGYFAGPNIFIIDQLGLTDPLLARLPPVKTTDWKPGHFERAIPAGYYCSVKNNDNCIYDTEIASYYEKIRTITRGNLWSLERFRTIWNINTGKYDYLLKNYQSN